ncbi:MAG: orotate phosphoribosyltransferase, partial [Eubacterium sp.]|nr:orotate phosphoribosyltransferase [Eubacterium sp.]
LEEIQEKYGFPANAIVTMEEVVEKLYNQECGGKVIIDDTIKAAIDAYYEQYGVK